MNMRQLRNFLLVAICAATIGILAGGVEAAGRFSLAPLNPDFVWYVQELEAGRYPDMIRPNTYQTSFSSFSSSSGEASARAALDVSFDLQAKGWLTSVKNQGSWGTCWDFAAIEAMESNLLKMTGKEHFLSELHLGFFAFYDESDDKPAFTVRAPEGKNQIFSNGSAFAQEATAILSRGTGPVLESDAPYPTDGSDKFWATYPKDPEALKKTLLAAPNQFRLKEALFFRNKDDIKRALTEHGALWVSLNADGLQTKPHVYHPDKLDPNHAVLLVGWDNTVSRELFTTEDENTPSEDGAWRIQNSWGTDAGDEGFNWISYEDATIINDFGAISYVAMPVDSYQHAYSYDPLGHCHAMNMANAGLKSAETANAFIAQRDEELLYVGFQTGTPGTQYRIQIYTDLEPNGDPDSGTPALATPITGTADFDGYHTVKLNAPVALAEGTRFAVHVTYTLPSTSTDNLYIPIEAAIDWYSHKATAGAGESYLKDTDGWVELRTFEDDNMQPTNLCIKAFTRETSNPNWSSSGGCATGTFALLLIVAIPVILRRRR